MVHGGLFSVYEDSWKSSLVLRILYVSQQKICWLLFCSHPFFASDALAWLASVPCSAGQLKAAPSVPLSSGTSLSLQGCLPLYPSSPPPPSHTVLVCSRIEWCPKPPLGPQHQPHLPPASTPQWQGCPIPTPLWHRLLPKSPTTETTQSCPSRGHDGLCLPQPHYPLSPQVFNKPHEQHFTTNLIQGSLPVQFICLTLRVAFPPAEVFIPLH